MKITLLNINAKNKYCSNKDIAGGFGTSTKIGNSFLAKLLESRKKKGVALPLLDFGYLAAIFRKNRHIVEYKEDVIPNDSDLIIIHSSAVDCKNEVAHIKKIKALTKTKVGVVGVFATVMPKLYSDADFVVVGEPEEAAKKISDKYIPKGIVKSKPTQNLDELPFPDWDGFPINRYSYKPAIKETPFLTIQSSRGCPYSCSHYCPYTVIQGTRFRKRTPKNVVDEIEYLQKKYSVKGLQFRDPVFTLDKGRAAKIASEIISRKIKIRWLCETRLDLLDRKLLGIMYRAGLRVINVGIESMHEDILKKSKRVPINIRHQEEIINFCRKKGIKVIAFYILGMKNDTKKSILETVRYAKKLNTYLAQFTISTPYPGTAYYNEMKKRIITDNYELYDANHLVFRHDNLTKKELHKLKEKAFVSYYFRLRWLLEYLRWSIEDLKK